MSAMDLQTFADEIGVSVRTAKRMVENGEVHALNVGRGVRKIYRIPITSFQQFCEERTVHAKPKRGTKPKMRGIPIIK